MQAALRVPLSYLSDQNKINQFFYFFITKTEVVHLSLWVSLFRCYCFFLVRASQHSNVKKAYEESHRTLVSVNSDSKDNCRSAPAN